MSCKADGDLFFIDTVGRDKTVNKRAIKKLKIDEIIEPQSAYTVGRAKAPKTAGEEALIARKAKSLSKSSTAANKAASGSAGNILRDLWADDDALGTATTTKRPAELLRPVLAEVPAVPAPGGAHSYNPVPEEHISFLEQLESKELARVAAIEATREKIAVPQATGKDMMIEANRKLILDQPYDESASETEEAAAAAKDGEPCRTVEPTPRLTKAERRKLARKRAHEAMMAGHRARKKFESSFGNISAIVNELKAAKEAEEALESVLPEVEKEVRKQTFQKKIKQRLALEPLAIKLPDEIPSCMRRLAVEGNLVSERFRSLVERGVVEPTGHIASSSDKKTKQKKSKEARPQFKQVERYSYKNFK